MRYTDVGEGCVGGEGGGIVMRCGVRDECGDGLGCGVAVGCDVEEGHVMLGRDMS